MKWVYIFIHARNNYNSQIKFKSVSPSSSHRGLVPDLLGCISCRPHRLPPPFTSYYFCVFWSGLPYSMHAPSLPGTPLALFWPTFGLCHTPPSSASCRHCSPAFPTFFSSIFSFSDLPQFVPIREVVCADMFTSGCCVRESMNGTSS